MNDLLDIHKYLTMYQAKVSAVLTEEVFSLF